MLARAIMTPKIKLTSVYNLSVTWQNLIHNKFSKVNFFDFTVS